jgi:hypothetical protein
VKKGFLARGDIACVSGGMLKHLGADKSKGVNQEIHQQSLSAFVFKLPKQEREANKPPNCVTFMRLAWAHRSLGKNSKRRPKEDELHECEGKRGGRPAV